MPHRHLNSHHVHRPRHAEPVVLEERDGGVATQVSIVFVTAAKTFSGDAVYSTPSFNLGAPLINSRTSDAATPTPTSTAKAVTTSATSTKATSTSTTSSKLSSTSTTSSTSSDDDQAETTSQDSSSSTTFATSTSATSSSASSSPSSASSIAAAAATSTSTSTPDATSSSGGMTGGAKAGLALGLLLGFGLILAAILFFYRKKRNAAQGQQRLDDEKHSINNGMVGGSPAPVGGVMSGAASVRTARTASTAPRLSLRPITQFMPTLDEKRRSKANELDQLSGTTAPVSKSNTDAAGFLAVSPQPSRSSWERRGEQQHANDPANPFGNHAEIENERSRAASPEKPRAKPESATLGSEVLPAAATVAAVGAAAAASEQKPKPHIPDSLKIHPGMGALAPVGEPSPAFSNFTEISETPSSPSMSAVEGADAALAAGSAAAIAAGGAMSPSKKPVNSVHRVQLDFKPSMDDELGLRAGQLVRLLHEYDDGWALCIRLDRSQQGVAPRSCLSKLPVKPRAPPQGPPPQGPPRMRGPAGPPGAVPRPLSPANARPMSPASARPMSPSNGGRSGSPMLGEPRTLFPREQRRDPRERAMSPPNGPYGRQMSPAGARPRARSNATPPRPMSPEALAARQQGLPPPMSPREGRRRSNSASRVMEKRNSPPVPSPLNPKSMAPQSGAVPQRKPVPGQAL